MSKFNHRVCEACWIERNSQEVEGGIEIRQPVVVKDIEFNIGMCCYCFLPTFQNIYVRIDPSQMPCNGEHE